ncbi:MAG: ComEA family DNA-binding protein [Firmicutes bacterium]|nr:ComEA family DNA-binding protein [Bacillota bacterium]
MPLWWVKLRQRVMSQKKTATLFLGLLCALWGIYAWQALSKAPVGHSQGTGLGLAAQSPVKYGSIARAKTVKYGSIARAKTVKPPTMTIYVVGAVRRPGLYHLVLDARIADVIAKAGGATADADLAAIDLAAVVEDGMEVVVPNRNQTEPVASVSGAADPSLANAGAESSGRSVAGKGHHKKELAPGERLNVNKASAIALEQLPGIGAKRAEAIIQFRSRHGLFTSIPELGHVPGIGVSVLAKITAYVTL